MTALAEIENLKKTPLYDEHVRLGGKMAGFGGWSMPIYYSSILAEHTASRQACGLFDVSHLGEVRVQGKGASDFLQKRLTNDIRKAKPGRILYNLLLQEDGGVMDDILVYCESSEDFYLIVNAANIESDFEALSAAAPSDVALTNHSDHMACLAVQGPKAEEALEKIFKFQLKKLPYYAFKEEKTADQSVWISRSGYTGEDGFEIFCPSELSVKLWRTLLEEGKPFGLVPAGLGARNTLRLEAGNLLCGSDMNRTTTPLEAGLGFAVSLDKPENFTGKAALVRQKSEGLKRRLVAFKVLEKSIARDHYPILKDGKKIGEVTSGSFGPTAGVNIGLGYVAAGNEAVGNEIEIEVHGRPVKAQIVKRPFVPLKHKKF